MLSSITLFIGITLMYSTPLAFAALGGVVSERSGVTNLGIEGMMTIGAFTGATVGYFTGSAWGGFLAAGAAGGMIALLHAFASITCRADQTISGIAINLIGPGVALFICRILF
ncbi:ABC transporter permease subunit, partial [Muricomes intestini]